MDNLYVKSENEDFISVTIINTYGTRVEYEIKVDFVTLNLMLQAEYVTVRGKTINNKTTRVDDDGKVYFYGDLIEERDI
ncbi:hypothetical protein BFM98_01425 [Lysinibacillus sp. AR18-8]|uniref:hypothetical protein n=1 Tax=Lysinibacillus sp. AR18-8 TaxID=1889781 RepID=UPI000824CCF2|nr:hypothetical protein [Lysinibacillus sp. AR18-8]OCX62690.1 hypothetical protein BFM98_01425 [Lysinibacillus sp. AR18-8]